MNVLRPYQSEAVHSSLLKLKEHRSTLLVMATGTGKTTVFSDIARQWKGRVLVLAHRTELVQQARARLQQDIGEMVGVDQGPFKSTFERIVVASVQTVYREQRIERIRRMSPPTLIIADEAHHAPAKSWMKILNAFPDAKVLGVTATPDRGDGRAMGIAFESVAYEYSIAQAVTDGWLVPLRGEEILLGEVNLDLVGVSAGDLAAGQLDEQMAQGAEGIVAGLQKYAYGKRGLVFTPGVKTAHYVSDRLNAIDPGSAAAVDGKTPTPEREQIVQDFRDGKIQWLCNCQVFTEGTDLPGAEVAAIARPTKSRSMYTQMVGRVGRVLPGVVDSLDFSEARRDAIHWSRKPYGLVLDFVGNNSRHSLACPEDILGGDYSDEERARAKQMRDEHELGEEATVADYLNGARDAIRRAAAVIKAQVQMERYSFDPLVMAGIDRENEERRLKLGGPVASPQQVQVLVKAFGHSEEDARAITRNAAKRLLNAHRKRKKQGLATVRQLKLLQRYGAASADVTMEAATKAIDYIKETGWGKTTDNKVVLQKLGLE